MRGLILAAVVALTLPAAAAGQHDRAHASLMFGVTEYDLSGVNTSPIYAVRVAGPLRRNLLIEGSLGYVRTDQQGGETDLFLPEVQAQLQGNWDRFSPYIGLGAGVAIDKPRDDDPVFDPETDVDFAPAFSAGVKVRVARGVGVRVDGRIHGIEADFVGTVSALTGGLTYTW